MTCIPRVVPRYHASLKKFTSILSASTARLTMAKKKTSRTLRNQLAASTDATTTSGSSTTATMCAGFIRATPPGPGGRCCRMRGPGPLYHGPAGAAGRIAWRTVFGQ